MQAQLKVIVFTDIVGFSSSMASDEAATLSLVAENSKLHRDLAAEHNGAVVKEIGDGQLMLFETASDAAKCMLQLLAEVSRQAQYQLRIGAHMGEVTVTSEDVFGDAVNIAARLEAFAENSTIVVSDSLYRSLRAKSDYHFRALGKRRFKNIQDKIGVYQLASAPLSQLPVWFTVRNFSASVLIIAVLAVTLFFVQSWLSREPAPELTTEASLLLNNSDLLLARGDKHSLNLAVQDIKQVISLEPNYLPAQTKLAQTYYQLASTYSDASIFAIASLIGESIEAVLQQDPDNQEAKILQILMQEQEHLQYHWRSKRSYDKIEFSNEARALLSSLDVDGPNYLSWRYIHQILEADGSDDSRQSVRQDILRRLKQNPNSPQLLKVHALFAPKQEVVKLLLRYQNLFPADLNLKVQLGWQYYEDGDLFSATKWWLESLDMQEDAVPNRMNLARVMFDLNEMAEVERLLDPMNRLNPFAVEAHWMAAHYLKRQGQDMAAGALLASLANRLDNQDTTYIAEILRLQALLLVEEPIAPELIQALEKQDLQKFDNRFLKFTGESMWWQLCRVAGSQELPSLGCHELVTEFEFRANYTESASDWHLLASAYALTGQEARSLTALERAEEAGWRRYWLSAGIFGQMELERTDEFQDFITTGESFIRITREKVYRELFQLGSTPLSN